MAKMARWVTAGQMTLQDASQCRDRLSSYNRQSPAYGNTRLRRIGIHPPMGDERADLRDDEPTIQGAEGDSLAWYCPTIDNGHTSKESKSNLGSFEAD